MGSQIVILIDNGYLKEVAKKAQDNKPKKIDYRKLTDEDF